MAASSSSFSSSSALRERHNQLIHIYREHTNSSSSRTALLSESDRKTLEEQHQFVRDDDDDETNAGDWGVRMARKYWNKLFKEYAICDLTLFQTGKIGMRWRVEKEVILGKGQFVCGNKHCDSTMDLHSYEVPFSYTEKAVNKTELVKCRVCLECAKKLFHEKLKRLTHQSKYDGKHKKSHGSVEEWPQEFSHDDIVRVLFDLGSAAESKEDPMTKSTDVLVDDDRPTSVTIDSNHDPHPQKKVKRSKSTVEHEHERDELQQLLI